MYVSHKGTPQYIRQAQTKKKKKGGGGEIVSNLKIYKKIVWTDDLYRKLIRKYKPMLHTRLNGLISSGYFIQMQNILFLSSAHGIFSKIDDILGPKSRLEKLKKNKS